MKNELLYSLSSVAYRINDPGGPQATDFAIAITSLARLVTGLARLTCNDLLTKFALTFRWQHNPVERTHSPAHPGLLEHQHLCLWSYPAHNHRTVPLYYAHLPCASPVLENSFFLWRNGNAIKLAVVSEASPVQCSPRWHMRVRTRS